MVAYSFQPRFVGPILLGTKRQTIRGHRRRHARPGEALQLYTGMRTKACRKILVEDPVCESVTPIRLTFHRQNGPYTWWLDDKRLNKSEMHQLALADGFTGEHSGFAARDMSDFWFERHGAAGDDLDFEGVLIRWRP